jgi:regulator of sigma E protease
MFLYIIIAVSSLVALMVIHELGHFLIARKFNVKVEEFGIGIPPRIIGKKIGETLYSLNLLPIGAFVKIYGEDEKIKDSRSFSEKSIFQRAMIILGGVIAFWIVAFLILSFIMATGTIVGIEDNVYAPDAQVMVTLVEENSPAQEAGIISGDLITRVDFNESEFLINKAGDLRIFLESYQPQEIDLFLTRGKENLSVLVVPLEQDNLIGVRLDRVVNKKYPLYQAPIQGLITTGRMTSFIVSTLGSITAKAVTGKPLPKEAQLIGPVAIVGEVFPEVLEKGLFDYLMIVVILSISLAIFNLLPIPALDGGRLLLLIIEKIKGSPINDKVEKSLIAFSFFILVGILILVTIYDVQRLL